VESLVVFVDDDEMILSAARRLLRQQPWRVEYFSDPTEAKSFLEGDERCSVIISDQRMPKMTGIELLSFAKKKRPHTVRMMVTGFLDDDVLEESVNEAGVFRFVTKPWDEVEILADIEKAIKHNELLEKQSQLLQVVAKQNKELEELTSNLEERVLERTRGVEKSKIEVEKAKAQREELVDFVRTLNSLNTVEDWLSHLYEDLFVNIKLNECAVVYHEGPLEYRAVFVRGGSCAKKTITEDWPKNIEIRIDAQKDRQWFADILGRPVTKLITIPIIGTEKFGLVTLHLEHSMNEEGIEGLLERVLDRIQPLRLSIERILLAQRLRLSSIEWESTFDAIQDPIAIVNKDYGVLRANRGFELSKGNEKYCYQKLMKRNETCPECPVPAAFSENDIKVSRVYSDDKAYDVYSYPIHLANQASPVSVVNHYVDVTTAQELRSKMIQNEKMAALGSLAGNIAHELNNPLTGIKSLAQILQQENGVNNELVSDLSEIEKATERSQKIIENLLDYSKGNQSKKHEKFSLRDVVSKTLPMLKSALRPHSTDIELGEGNDFVIGNPQLLQQVIFNLINNASQAMPEAGTLTVHVKCKESHVELFVADTGIGIPESVKEKMFEPFFTTKEKGKGTGLGLSLVGSVVTEHGGEISVTSEINRGTEFKVTLPLCKEPQ
jgi:two-component system NtrC family sensor kinase